MNTTQTLPTITALDAYNLMTALQQWKATQERANALAKTEAREGNWGAELNESGWRTYQSIADRLADLIEQNLDRLSNTEFSASARVSLMWGTRPVGDFFTVTA